MRDRKGLSAPVPEAAAPQTPSVRRVAVEVAPPERGREQLGLEFGETRWLLAGIRLLVGRAGGGVHADVELSDPSVSRRHAELIATPEGWHVRDLGSTNGTRVGKIALRPGEAMAVREGDVVCFGHIEVVVVSW